MENFFELTPKFASVLSFYRKAFVIVNENSIKLRSYNTIVAEIDLATNKLTVYGLYSQTTRRHIREFMSQYGYELPHPLRCGVYTK